MRTITTTTILATSLIRQGKTIVVDGNRTLVLRDFCASLARGLFVLGRCRALAGYRLALLLQRKPAGRSWQPAACWSHRPACAQQHECRWMPGVVSHAAVGVS